jgi:AraC-like DNA-binding protein
MRESREVRKMISLLTERLELIKKLNDNAEQLNTESNHLEYGSYDDEETSYCNAHLSTLEWMIEGE